MQAVPAALTGGPLRYAVLVPEAALAVGAVVMFFITLTTSPVRGRRARRVLAAALVVAALSAAWSLIAGAPDDFLFASYRVDALAEAAKLFVVLLGSVALVAGRLDDGQWADARGDGALFTAVTLLGALVALSAADLVALTVAVAATAAGYTGAILAGGRRAASENPARRVVIGLLTGGFLMLAGVAILAGLTGTTRIDDVGRALAAATAPPAAWMAGLALVLFGLAPLLGVPPFQTGWSQVVSRAAPGAAVLAAGPLWATGALLLVRVASGASAYAAGLGTGFTIAGTLVAIFGAVRAARPGRDARDSAAALGLLQTGALLFVLAPQTPAAWGGALLIVAAAAVAQTALLLALARVGHGKDRVAPGDLAGLLGAAPAAGLAVTLGAAALCGVPPAAGFTGRWAGGAAALAEGWIAALVLMVLAALLGLRGAVPLLRAVWTRGRAGVPGAWRPGDQVVLAVLALALLAGGMLPGPVLAAAARLAGLLRP